MKYTMAEILEWVVPRLLSALRMGLKKRLLGLIPTCGRYKIEEAAAVGQSCARFSYSGFLSGTSPCSTGTLVTLKTTGRSESGQL